MTEAAVLQAMREHYEGLFPKECAVCHRRFMTLQDYVKATRPVGPYISHDADAGDWRPPEPMGAWALANCPCGDTLSLGTDAMSIEQRLRLLGWVRDEAQRRSVSPADLLDHLRLELRRQLGGLTE
jgi:hypothetical protein